MPRSIRGLLGRIRDRVAPPPRVGDRYLPAHRATLDDFSDIAHQAFQLVGAGLVQSWEIAVAEVGRALRAARPDDAEALIERWSDALVPTETPVQTLSRRVSKILERGHKRAQKSGALLDALGELNGELEQLGGRIAGGWSGTIEHLGPIFEALPDGGAGLIERSDALGREMQRGLDEAAAEFRQAALSLPDAPDLQRALFEALDTYQAAAIACFEVNIYALKGAVIEAARPGA